MKRTKSYAIQRKNIDLPVAVIDILKKMAEKEFIELKPYLEKVLIEHSGVDMEKLEKVDATHQDGARPKTKSKKASK